MTHLQQLPQVQSIRNVKMSRGSLSKKNILTVKKDQLYAGKIS